MNKKIKLSLLGTLIAGSALAVTLPIVSCSASTDVVLTATEVAGAATTAYATYIKTAATAVAQQVFVNKGHKITKGTTVFADLLKAVTFTETDDTTITVAASDAIESFEVTTAGTVEAGKPIAAGVQLTVNLHGGYTTDSVILLSLGALGDGGTK